MASRPTFVLLLAVLTTAAALVHVARDVPAEESRWVKETLNSSMGLSQTFELIAAKLPEGPTKEMMSRMKVCTSCKEFRRLGEWKDGGYLMCMDGLEGKNIRAAYSMGVEHHDQFSNDIYNLLRVPVHQFDCTVKGPAQNCPDCHFNKVCLQGRSGGGAHPIGPNMDMQQVLEHTGQASAPEDSLVMKMDIEGAEWPIYADGQSGLKQFKQLVFEFHRLSKEGAHAQYASALKNIEDAGFKVAHIHGNNHGGMYYKEGYAVPDVLEVTYVKNNPALAVCESDQHLHPLDHDNYPKGKPLPMAHLPE